MGMTPRLGVNIDHVATLRQARGESYPSVVEAANVCLSNGADQITIHLREDRRHIQDTDVEAVRLVTKRYGKPLNLEIGCNQEIIDIAIATNPDWICLVPENRQERTTEGGLNLLDEKDFEKVKSTCETLKDKLPERHSFHYFLSLTFLFSRRHHKSGVMQLKYILETLLAPILMAKIMSDI